MGLTIILLIVGLIISYVLSEEFMNIAKKKGYTDRKYFWFSFLFGIAGYLMVVALPVREFNTSKTASDKNFESKILKENDRKKEVNYVGNFPVADFSADDGLKQCPICGTCHDSAFTVCPACKHIYDK